jgi:hypothetical protein
MKKINASINMEQKLKDLLVKDLCARLPYNVKCNINFNQKNGTLTTELLQGVMTDSISVKPYLRSISTMTEEEKEELVDFLTASDLEDYVRVEDIADVVRTDDLDYYVKVEDAVDFLTASDLDVYALKSELPVNVSELTNDAGYLTQHQDLSAYALKSELPLEGTFPTDSDSDSDIDDGYATVQGVIDYIDAYFEKKKG